MDSHLFTTSPQFKIPDAGVRFDQCLGRSNDYMHWRTIRVNSIVDATHFYGTVVRSWSEQLDASGCRAEYIDSFRYTNDLKELSEVINEHADYIHGVFDCKNVWSGVKYFFRSILWAIQEKLGFDSGRYSYVYCIKTPRKFRQYL